MKSKICQALLVLAVAACFFGLCALFIWLVSRFIIPALALVTWGALL